eukprot:m.80453 g.80453  ORF g.80453 m.80453 type:complete len:137 (-) comp14209_c0_seq3:72-482(-)
MAQCVDVSVDVPFSVSESYRRWLDCVWINGGGLGKPDIIDEGDPSNNHLGCIRRVPGGIQEKIVEVKTDDFISYKIISGPFPVRSHFATVTFKQKQTEITNIHWHCEMDIPWGLQWIVLAITRFVFSRMLSSITSS